MSKARLPSKGRGFTAYKWARARFGSYGFSNQEARVLLTLYIPANAARVRPFTDGLRSLRARKCRASSVIVRKVELIDSLLGHELKDLVAIYSDYFHSREGERFYFHVGKRVKCREPFDLSPLKSCSSGIHFFLEKRLAQEWLYG